MLKVESSTVRTSKWAGVGGFIPRSKITLDEEGIAVFSKADVCCRCDLSSCCYHQLRMEEKYRWEQVKRVDHHQGLFWSTFHIETSDGSLFRIRGFSKTMALKFWEATRAYESRFASLLPADPDVAPPAAKKFSTMPCCDLQDKKPVQIKRIYHS